MKRTKEGKNNCQSIFQITIFTLGLLFFGIQSGSTQDQRPNIVLIVADDLGFGDIGCYGGDISTPNIDALAQEGIMFTSFHTAPMCAPTRAMLITGNDNHIAGVGLQSRHTQEFGYEGKLTNRVVPIPALLKDAGYHTYMVGKWHLGNDAATDPYQKGFEKTFVLIEAAGNHYNNRSALKKGFAKFTEDGYSTQWKDGEYSTDFYTDKVLEYIDLNQKDEKPFFAYVAYTSPHWPLQVDKKYWKKYKDSYDEGYEKLKDKRFKQLKSAGIIPAHAQMPPSHERVIPWDSLSRDQQKKEARKMELYAGMVTNLDDNIGRLISHLKANGQYENTLFVFMSDNGAAHRDFINVDSRPGLKEYYNEEYRNMGKENSYVSYGPQWAEAGSAPFRYFKDYATQGGINTTLIISGPNVEKKPDMHHGFTSLLDLAPTFYEIAGASYPEVYAGQAVYPLRGKSLLPFLSGKTAEIHSSDYVFALEHAGNAMVRKGEWKITSFIKPFKLENFALYNLSNDLAEQTDLKESEPEKYQELLAEWAKYAKETQLQFPPPKDKK